MTDDDVITDFQFLSGFQVVSGRGRGDIDSIPFNSFPDSSQRSFSMGDCGAYFSFQFLSGFQENCRRNTDIRGI